MIPPGLKAIGWATVLTAAVLLVLLVLLLVEIGELDGVEEVFDLLICEDLLLADHFEEPLAALVGFVGELGRFFVTEHWIQRGHDPYRRFHVPFENLLVNGDAVDALCTECL